MEEYRDVPTASVIMASGGGLWDRSHFRIRVSDELLRDSIDIRALMERQMLRAFTRFEFPWEFPDRPCFPMIELFPRLTHLQWRVVHIRLWFYSWRTLRLHRCDPPSDDYDY